MSSKIAADRAIAEESVLGTRNCSVCCIISRSTAVDRAPAGLLSSIISHTEPEPPRDSESFFVSLDLLIKVLHFCESMSVIARLYITVCPYLS